MELADEVRFTTIKESSDDPRRITRFAQLRKSVSTVRGRRRFGFREPCFEIDGWVSGL